MLRSSPMSSMRRRTTRRTLWSIVSILGMMVLIVVNNMTARTTGRHQLHGANSNQKRTSSFTSSPSVEQAISGRYLEESHHTMTVDTGSSNSHTATTPMEHQEDEEHEAEDELSQLELTCIVVIALLLIVLTILFETVKEHVEESVNHEMEIILEKLFGELTILGFLATIVFIVSQSGLLAWVSELIGTDEHELTEYVEYVHYTIFFIMVGFVVQVLVLVQEASETEEQWSEYDDACRSKQQEEQENDKRQQQSDVLQRNPIDTIESERLLTPDEELRLHEHSHTRWYRRFLPRFLFNSDEMESLREKLVFQALRNEFLLERSPHSPFTPADDEKRVEGDFYFGRYLGLAQIHILTHVVEVNISTWVAFALGAISFYLLALTVNEDLWLLSWAWIVIGWLVFLFNIVFEIHLTDLRNIFLPRRVLSVLNDKPVTFAMGEDVSRSMDASFRVTRTSLIKRNSSPSLTESTPLNNTNGSNLEDLEEYINRQQLPIWCDFSVDEFKRSWWAKLFVSGVPNRQQCFYWFDRHGPGLYLHLLQLNLIFTGLYGGMLILVFLPKVWSVHSPLTFAIYLALAVLPGIGIMYNKKNLVAILTQVCSVGSYRKPQIIADVRREAKTCLTVRTFLVFQKMRVYVEGKSRNNVVRSRRVSSLNDSLSTMEQAQIAETFKSLDADGSGAITNDELIDFLERMGMPTDDESVHQLVNSLDVDGDGEITRDEFLLWYVDAMREDLSMHERAKQLFGIFDANSNGEITIGDFKAKFDALNLGFSIDEIGSIVNELDKDRSGSVSLHEFEFFLERYYPKELLRVDTDHAGAVGTTEDNVHGHPGNQSRHGSSHRH